MTETTQTLDRTQVVLAIAAGLRAVLDTELPDITEDTRLFDLGLDSTGVLELLLFLEDELGQEIESENLRMEHFQSVRSLADFVAAALSE